jgi:hypothetical protein
MAVAAFCPSCRAIDRNAIDSPARGANKMARCIAHDDRPLAYSRGSRDGVALAGLKARHPFSIMTAAQLYLNFGQLLELVLTRARQHGLATVFVELEAAVGHSYQMPPRWRKPLFGASCSR